MLMTLVIGVAIAALGAALLLVRQPRTVQAGLVALACLTLMLAGFTQPALAGAVNGDALTGGQKELNQTLKSAPNDNQFQGIEYADVKGTPLGDQEITDRVEGAVPENLKVSVSNGSVRLTGKVADRSAAQAIVDDVKAIPGVHEVAYDLGLEG